MSTWLVPTVAFLGSLGLAGSIMGGCSGAGHGKGNSQLQQTIDELETAARRERYKMRDLEVEMSRLEHRVRTAETGPGHGMPNLPVHVLEPERATSADMDMDVDMDVGVDTTGAIGGDDEVEIVYVGEAALDRSVTPRTNYLQEQQSGRSRASERSPERQSPGQSEQATWDEPDERLTIMDDVGPTVERQLAEARSGGARARPATTTVAAPIPSKVSEAPAARPKTATAKPGDGDNDPRVQYRRYYEALRAGNHGFAIAGFENFIARYPDHEYTDNARYWLAEAHYDQRAYKVALGEFTKVLRDYPKGNKVPDAMLKIGFCHIALGDGAKARDTLQELVKRHPTSKPAALAAHRLETLRGD